VVVVGVGQEEKVHPGGRAEGPSEETIESVDSREEPGIDKESGLPQDQVKRERVIGKVEYVPIDSPLHSLLLSSLGPWPDSYSTRTSGDGEESAPDLEPRRKGRHTARSSNRRSPQG